jgi:hypothetical protein
MVAGILINFNSSFEAVPSGLHQGYLAVILIQMKAERMDPGDKTIYTYISAA